MPDDEKTVVFKSTGVNYMKECDGVKPNTFRKIDEKDKRFEWLRGGKAKYIIIVNPDAARDGGPEQFKRSITDYTEWNGWAIISWKDEAQRTRLLRKVEEIIDKTECSEHTWRKSSLVRSFVTTLHCELKALKGEEVEK